MKTESIKLAEITIDGGTQTRSGIDGECVRDYAERMVAGDKFPPVVVFYDGASYYLADGFHRYHAAAQNEFKDILADVRKGTRLDALKFSLGANITNGLRRTNEDKRYSVQVALKEFSRLSDRAIAELCRVSDHLVAELRVLAVESPEGPRVGLDGRTRRVPARKPQSVESEPAEASPAPPVAPAPEEPAERPPAFDALRVASNCVSWLNSIPPRHKDRQRAFDIVSEWITSHTKAQHKK